MSVVSKYGLLSCCSQTLDTTLSQSDLLDTNETNILSSRVKVYYRRHKSFQQCGSTDCGVIALLNCFGCYDISKSNFDQQDYDMVINNSRLAIIDMMKLVIEYAGKDESFSFIKTRTVNHNIRREKHNVPEVVSKTITKSNPEDTQPTDVKSLPADDKSFTILSSEISQKQYQPIFFNVSDKNVRLDINHYDTSSKLYSPMDIVKMILEMFETDQCDKLTSENKTTLFKLMKDHHTFSILSKNDSQWFPISAAIVEFDYTSHFNNDTSREVAVMIIHHIHLPCSDVDMTYVMNLGHILTPAGVSPVPAKVDAILHLQLPSNVKQLCSLIGMVNYYHDHLHH